MSVTQLSSRDFYLAGRRKKTLNISLSGNVLVFFKMPGCQGCRAFEPIFYQLFQNDKRVTYAVCDIAINKEVPQLSRQTNNPIQAVPWIFFYSDGYPVARFKGKKNIPSIQAFVGKALQEAQNRRRRTQSNFVPQQSQQGGNMYNGQYGQSHTGGYQGGNQGGRGNPNKYWKPEIGKTPKMGGIVKGGGGASQYSYLGNEVEEEDDIKALMPDNVTPHNKPWQSEYRKVSSFD